MSNLPHLLLDLPPPPRNISQVGEYSKARLASASTKGQLPVGGGAVLSSCSQHLDAVYPPDLSQPPPLLRAIIMCVPATLPGGDGVLPDQRPRGGDPSVARSLKPGNFFPHEGLTFGSPEPESPPQETVTWSASAGC